LQKLDPELDDGMTEKYCLVTTDGNQLALSSRSGFNEFQFVPINSDAPMHWHLVGGHSNIVDEMRE